jgi:alanyl-tRNA synthetase
METRSGSQIREDYLRYFEGKVSAATGQGHRRVHSSSLVPANDPTLLFTNAGMNQFKDVFLGAERREYSRATTSQKCVRAGGKHNDLENVGFTRRHHTFFEMLGNFSFGDYFKKDAIAYAWELLTSKEWFGLDPAKLYITIFEGDSAVPRDEEAYKFWVEAGVPAERIFTMSAKDNFWAMGDTGPCGPCSEIYFDMGAEASLSGKDMPFPQDEERYVEIWNLVFMQFDRGSDGVLTPLPKPSIDTGMGLERVAAVMQGVLSNFETDLFVPLIAKARELTGRLDLRAVSEEQLSADSLKQVAGSEEKGAASLRIIADHARAATFLISDGVVPANEGRGYVLRKILRRGIRHGRLLGQEKPFMHEMVFAVRDEMQVAYPELKETVERVSRTVKAEEEQFARVLEVGWRAFEVELYDVMRRAVLITLLRLQADNQEVKDLVEEEAKRETSSRFGPQFEASLLNIIGAEQFSTYQQLRNATEWQQSSIFSGKAAFDLYQTYGLPLDFIVDAVRDAHLRFDMEGFEKAKEEEQARARASWKGGSQKTASPVYRELAKTEYTGYSALRVDGARVLALVKDGVGVAELRAGEAGEVVLDATSFYADSGGQVGDVGWLVGAGHSTVVADVSGASKPVQGVWAHRVVVRQNQRIAVGDTVDTLVDGEVRAAVTRNHTGTHLLHAALREVLGRHVKQAGSSVDRARLRFDFSHFAGVAEEELAQIEEIVNRQVLANTAVETMVDVPIDVAVQELGAMALFGEKYGDKVRVVKIGDFSTELCGGTHTRATGEIGLIKLVGEGSVSSGVRRVEAVSGWGALGEFRRDYEVARVVGQMVGGAETSGQSESALADALRARLAATEEEMKKLRRELDAARMKSASAAAGEASAVEVKGIKLLVQRVDGLERGPMRDLVDQMRGKLGSGVVVLGAASEDGKVALIVGVTKDLTGKVHAGKIVGALAGLVGGKGGGRPDLAEAGGSDVGALDGALAKAAEVVGGLL